MVLYHVYTMTYSLLIVIIYDNTVENIEVIVYTWYSTWCILIMYVLYMTISREYWGHCVHHGTVPCVHNDLFMYDCHIWQSVANIEVIVYTMTSIFLSCMCYIWQSVENIEVIVPCVQYMVSYLSTDCHI